MYYSVIFFYITNDLITLQKGVPKGIILGPILLFQGKFQMKSVGWNSLQRGNPTIYKHFTEFHIIVFILFTDFLDIVYVRGFKNYIVIIPFLSKT